MAEQHQQGFQGTEPTGEYPQTLDKVSQDYWDVQQDLAPKRNVYACGL